jgi:PAS domain-containing protein
VTRFRRKDGSPIWVNTFVSTISGSENSPPIYIATAIDISDRHKAESELRRIATYLAEAEKLSHTGCWARNTKTGELFWSQEEWRIFGLHPGTTQLSYQVYLDLVHPEDRAKLEEESARAVRNKEPYDILFRAVLRDGTIKHLHSVGKPQIEEAGAVVEYIGVTMDETEHVRANAAMQEAQAELARVARLTTMGELAASGEDIRQEPIEDRKRRLAALLRQPRDGNAHLLKTSKMLHRCYGSEGQIVTFAIQHWINFGHTFSYGRVSKVVRCNSNWQRH